MRGPDILRDLIFAVCCLALAGMPLPLRAQEPPVPGPPVMLVAPDTVRDFLARHLDLPARFAIVDSRAALTRRARREVAELLATEGYFSPRVEVHPAAPGAEGLVIEVEPGPQTRIESVALEFSGHLAGEGGAETARRAALRAAWPLQAGAPFRSPVWEEAKAALLAGAVETDYAGARIAASRAAVDPARAAARLTVMLDAGEPYRFGALTIQGLKRYDEALVRRLAPFAAGEPYRRDQLLAFQSRLQNTPWFHSVLVGADPAAAVNNEIPVEVALAETPSRRLGFGAGYSTNSGARGEVNYHDHDFLGRAWDFGSGLRLEEMRQTLFADLGLLPDERGYRLSFGGRLESSDIQGLASTRQQLGIARSRASEHIETRLSLEWQRENRRPSGAAAGTDHALTTDWRWIRRNVDDTLNPRRGNLVEFRLGGASKHLLSSRDFVRTHLRAQHWWPLGRYDTLSLRGEAGTTVAGSRFGIPENYLFRAGGAQSVRGYAYHSLGVREGSATVGGRALLTGSLEYTHWFDRDWGAALFVDAGNAADHWRGMKPLFGSGVGARWRSPAGPLALDVARGLESGRWHLHFSIMVAF